MARGKIKLFLSAIIVLVLLLFLLRVFSNFGGLAWTLELIGTTVLAIFAVFGLALSKSSCGERAMFVVSILNFGNIILMWYLLGVFSYILFFLTLILLLLNFPNRTWRKSCDKSCCELPRSVEPHSEIFPDNDVKVTVKNEGLKVVPSAAKKTVTNKSSNLVASSRSKIYHKPSCDWAKKINPKGKITFKSKEEAWEKGYRAHSCVK
ncbi:MAG: hypothetical protein ABIG93_02075 [archaeon]|nr:hypothetical protein [Nanoarchaeota archaeon]